MKFFDDIRIGDREQLGHHTFTAEEIKSFAARFDPQPFHLDEAAAAQTHFGRLCASGWHTAAMCMRKLVDCRRDEDAARRARNEPVAKVGASPGFRDLKWLKPVFAGDTITYDSEVVALRMSERRPKWGLMTARKTGTNQRGEVVLTLESVAFVERRAPRGEP